MNPSDEDVDQVAAMLINGDEGRFISNKTVAVWRASDHAGDCIHAEVKGTFTCGRCLADEATKNSIAIFEELQSRGWRKVPELRLDDPTREDGYVASGGLPIQPFS